jgi:hypothetical protein
MNHLVRVHLDADESIEPLTYRVVDARGEVLTEGRLTEEAS